MSLPPVPTPAWLLELTAEQLAQDPLPLTNLLHNSVYYPAAGNDGKVIELVNKFAPSFVQVDYSLTKAEIESQLRAAECFAGYDLLGLRTVRQQELTPVGWQPTLRNTRRHRPLPDSASPANAFAIWAVFVRRTTHSSQHGAERFSLLHLHAEGVAAYDALYRGNQQQAAFLAIVNPSEGYGDNWTYFTRPNYPLHQVVMGNPQGAPVNLIWGGGGALEAYSTQACWPEYTTLIEQKSQWASQKDWNYFAFWQK